MNIQAKVALDKEQHPEKYCPVKRCLWVVTKWAQPGSNLRVLRENCLTGYCPRHKHLAQDAPGVTIQESF
jgi:predicted amidohydrolase